MRVTASSLPDGFGCAPNLRLCYADLIHVRKCRWSDLPGLEAIRRGDRESADAPFQVAFSAPTTVFRVGFLFMLFSQAFKDRDFRQIENFSCTRSCQEGSASKIMLLMKLWSWQKENLPSIGTLFARPSRRPRQSSSRAWCRCPKLIGRQSRLWL